MDQARCLPAHLRRCKFTYGIRMYSCPIVQVYLLICIVHYFCMIGSMPEIYYSVYLLFVYDITWSIFLAYISRTVCLLSFMVGMSSLFICCLCMILPGQSSWRTSRGRCASWASWWGWAHCLSIVCVWYYLVNLLGVHLEDGVPLELHGGGELTRAQAEVSWRYHELVHL